MVMDRLRNHLNKEFDIDERIRYFKRRKLYSVEIEFTRSCNLSCIYCFTDSINSLSNSLAYDKAKELIDDLIEYGLKSFWWIGGGESLLYADWYKVLKYAKEQGAKENLIFTNGLLLTKSNCRKIIEVGDRVNLHLDTIKSESFKNLQNKSNDSTMFYEKILEGIDNLLNEGFDPNKIRWNITLTKTSFNDLEETISYVLDKGVQSITLIPLFKSGRCTQKVFDREHLSIDEIKKAFYLRAKMTKKPYLLKLGPSEYCKQYQLTTFAISSSGNVYPYIDYYVSYGNIYLDRINTIIKKNIDKLSLSSLVTKSTYKNLLRGRCCECIDQKYCFGNPTMVYETRNNIIESDPYCWRATKSYK